MFKLHSVQPNNPKYVHILNFNRAHQMSFKQSKLLAFLEHQQFSTCPSNSPWYIASLKSRPIFSDYKPRVAELTDSKRVFPSGRSRDRQEVPLSRHAWQWILSGAKGFTRHLQPSRDSSVGFSSLFCVYMVKSSLQNGEHSLSTI